MSHWDAVQQAAQEPAHTRDQMKAFLSPPPGFSAMLKNVYGFAEVRLDEGSGQIRTSYAMQLVERDVLGKDAAVCIVAGSSGKKLPYVLHTLTIAAVLYRRMNVSDREGPRWSSLLARAMAGLDVIPDRPAHRVDTEGGLAAAAAVVQFVIAFSDHKVTRIFSKDGRELDGGRAIVNPHLDRLVRERPEDVDRIISYVGERGMPPKRRRDVDELREWLDADAAAIADGWL